MWEGNPQDPMPKKSDLDEELKRVIPVIEKISAHSDVFISIDTYKSKVAQEACPAGAHMINDISGLTFDPQMAGIAGGTARLCSDYAHQRGRRKTCRKSLL